MEYRVEEDGIKLILEYERDTVRRIRGITGREFISDEQAWAIPLFAIEELCEQFDVPQKIIDEVLQKRKDRMKILSESTLKHDLKPFQVQGVSFLIERRKSFLCADMGLGKTCMSLAFSEMLFNSKNIERTFIVCPKSLIQHWVDEIEKFIGDTSVLVIQGDKKKRVKLWASAYQYKYVITNYEQIRNMFNFERISSYMKYPSLIVLDEATRIKNHKALVSRQIKKLNAPFKAVLSGRPLENRPEELFSINEFLRNNVLGTWSLFKSRYIVEDAFGRPSYYVNLDELSRQIKSIMFRCKKEDVLDDLPERIDSIYSVKLSAPEHRDYKQITTKIVTFMDIYKNKREAHIMRDILGSIQLAKMYCDHPDLVRYSEAKSVKDMVISSNVSTKFDEFFRIIDEISGKVVVFTQYARMVELIGKELEARGYDYVTVTGKTKNRDEKIQQFRDDKQILVSTDVLGYGINLQFASYIINYDLPWNPAVLEQRIARLHRMGQHSTVQVINLVVEDEDKIESKIRRVLNQKDDLFKIIIDGE